MTTMAVTAVITNFEQQTTHTKLLKGRPPKGSVASIRSNGELWRASTLFNHNNEHCWFGWSLIIIRRSNIFKFFITMLFFSDCLRGLQSFTAVDNHRHPISWSTCEKMSDFSSIFGCSRTPILRGTPRWKFLLFLTCDKISCATNLIAPLCFLWSVSLVFYVWTIGFAVLSI